jgi:hypothetical protein
MLPGLGLHLEQGDLHEKPPELGRAFDGKLAAGTAAKKRTKYRLDHILSVQPACKLPAEVLLGQVGQPLRVPVEDLLRCLGITCLQLSG